MFVFNALWADRHDWNRQWALCCDQAPLSTRILDHVHAVQRATGLPSPMVANADIGFLTEKKVVNVTDLGLLGDPLLTRVFNRAASEQRLDVVVEYLDRYAVPDVVEAHGIWSCQYAPWLTSEEFIARYRKVWSDGWSEQFLRGACPHAAGVGGGIWVRDDYATGDGSAEVRLSRALARDPSPARVRRALAECRARDVAGEPWGCQYVTRSVYRNLRAFAAAGTLDRTIALFRGPTARYDRAVLQARARGSWYADAVDFLFSARARPSA
jgi:hypothetical protein